MMLLNAKLTTKELFILQSFPQHVAAVDELVIFILLSDTRTKQNIVKQCQQNTILQKRKSFETLNAA